MKDEINEFLEPYALAREILKENEVAARKFTRDKQLLLAEISRLQQVIKKLAENRGPYIKDLIHRNNLLVDALQTQKSSLLTTENALNEWSLWRRKFDSSILEIIDAE